MLFSNNKPARKVFTVILLYLVPFLSFSQSINDYRSVGNGNWTNVSIWETYNGTAWVVAANYPGQVAGTNNVFIEGGFSVTISSNIPNNFNSLTIGPGELLVSSNSSLDTPLITLISGGSAEWTSNNTTLSLPANASVIIAGGNLVEANPCNATKRLSIGGVIYATCNGGGPGVDYDFGDINTGGGTLTVSPTSNSPLCIGETLNLLANPAGAGSNETMTTFSWSGTGPGGYTFNSSVQDPIINTTLLNAGTYAFMVTITDPNSNTNTNTVDIIITASPNAPVSNGNQRICIGGTIPALTVTVGAGETVDWYDTASGGNLILSDNTSYTPVVAGSYFAEARNTSAGCTSTTRTEVVLNISSCKVVTNRRISFRVRRN
ncbi:hypothetical protein U6A24_00030 [Aquimarina gracilis]|uniref:Ig-like domain-containing protein n=1 Tax=Aquimarina gracilis TaxID=874422 RepID=A0ABU5ZNS7_9FLAO|nr:hypothetical protein [Aquimarina gracilis]MEB3343821.1 hypothetical protein [Aquimarina gracilis]